MSLPLPVSSSPSKGFLAPVGVFNYHGSQQRMRLRRSLIGIFLPDLGDDGGERNVVEDPARTAEYTTDSTVVSIPSIRALNETCLECL